MTCSNAMFSCTQGDEDQLKGSLPNLQELDLTGNLLSDCQVFQQFGNALPSLICVNLSQNFLTLPSSTATSSTPPNATLRTLVLNKCRLIWSQVCKTQPSPLAVQFCPNPSVLAHRFVAAGVVNASQPAKLARATPLQ